MNEPAAPPTPPRPVAPSWAGVFLVGLVETGKQIARKLRWVALGALLLVMQWPLQQVDSLVYERQQRRDEATTEVTSHFGAPQTLVGPILTVPYRIWKTEEWTENGKKKTQVTWRRGYAHFLPAELRLSAAVAPEIRRRGLFEVAVYTADVVLSGKFDAPSFGVWSVAAGDVLWAEAWLSFEVTDRKGLRTPLHLSMGGEDLGFEVGAPAGGPLARSLQARVSESTARAGGTFTGQVKVRGSHSLQVAPMGGRTSLAMSSSWPHPSFSGAYLPDRPVVRARGFEAEWTVLRFGRDFGQSWTSQAENGTGTALAESAVASSAFGATFKNPTDLYAEIARSSRYSLLFLVMTFLVLYLWEVLRQRPIHPLQYLLCGSALALFYVLELALAEHFGFVGAYAAAAGAIVAMIGLYARAIFASGRGALALGAMLTALYAFLFVTLQAEDHALMIGAIGLLFLLACVMYATRRMNRPAAA
jgi:inner membrane protein